MNFPKIPWNAETKTILLIMVSVILVVAILAFIIEMSRNKDIDVETDFIKDDSKKDNQPQKTEVFVKVNLNRDKKKAKPAPQEEVIEVKPEPVVEKEPEVVEEVKKPERKPEVIEEDSFEGVLRYNRSFTARLIQSDDDTKHWYTELKNNLLSYKKSKARMSWKRESFRIGREPLARFAYRGKTLCVYLPLNAADFEDTKYKVEDASDSVQFEDTPCMYRIKNARRAKYAMELIALVAERLNAPRIERETEDFYVPYEGLLELINKGLIKRNVVNKKEDFFVDLNGENDEKEATELEVAPGLIVKSKAKDSSKNKEEKEAVTSK